MVAYRTRSALREHMRCPLLLCSLLLRRSCRLRRGRCPTAPESSRQERRMSPHFLKRIIDAHVTNFRRQHPWPLPVLRHLLRKVFSVSLAADLGAAGACPTGRRPGPQPAVWSGPLPGFPRGEPRMAIYLRIGATNYDMERCGELRETTPCVLVVAPQLCAVGNIKITSRFRRPRVLRQYKPCPFLTGPRTCS